MILRMVSIRKAATRTMIHRPTTTCLSWIMRLVCVVMVVVPWSPVTGRSWSSILPFQEESSSSSSSSSSSLATTHHNLRPRDTALDRILVESSIIIEETTSIAALDQFDDDDGFVITYGKTSHPSSQPITTHSTPPSVSPSALPSEGPSVRPTSSPSSRPTTLAPTTLAPTIETPTTEAPTIEAPTTLVPTIEALTIEAPTTEAPTIEAPTTLVPTIEAPATAIPVSTVVPTISPTPSPTRTKIVTVNESITTKLQGDKVSNGNMFDVQAMVDLNITQFHIHTDDEGSMRVSIWTKEDTYKGYRGREFGWTKVMDNVLIEGMGMDSFTPVPPLDNPIVLAKGARQAFYISLDENHKLRYSDGDSEGEEADSNNELRIYEGIGVQYLFDVAYSPRIWNGIITYQRVISTSNSSNTPYKAHSSTDI